MADIMSRRAAFSAHNVSRVQQLIRCLSSRRFKLFRQIPLLLHLNRPRTPGYISDVRVPYGIYRFQDTGFWKQALADLKKPEKFLRPFLSSRPYIQGLYLMGSAGTLAQTEASDFDYWVVVNQEGVEPAERSLFERKLRMIETWCRERYGQAVTFFLLDEGQVRANAFDLMDEESSGSAQKTLLKEEFYRTFIMIAGRIPFWAVLPSGLDDRQYRERIDRVLTGRHLRFIPEDYIDLGNLAALDRDESLGALLWQVYKSRHSPAKSLIKSALIAHYFFSDGHFLCDIIKTRFSEEEGGNSLLDPYALMFETGLSFIEDLEDSAALELLQTCIFFRLSAYKPVLPAAGEGTPRESLLHEYLRRWGWDSNKVHHLSRYHQWLEAEKIRFERAVVEKIYFIYELVLKARDRGKDAVRMSERDLALLTNRIAVYYKAEVGKIPRCSAYARGHMAALQLVVEGGGGESEATRWRVFGGEAIRTIEPDRLFFDGPELLKVAGWLVMNGFYAGKQSPVSFQAGPGCEVTGNQARRFVRTVHQFLTTGPVAKLPDEARAAWARILVCLHRSGGGPRGRLEAADFLVVNTWGEFFFDTLALSKLKTDVEACYHIAEHVWLFSKEATAFRLPFRLIHPGGAGDVDAERSVEAYLKQFIENAAALKSLDGGDNPLLLDGW
jgi:adenylate cyclase class 1